MAATRLDAIGNNCLAKRRTAVSLEEDEDSGAGREDQFKSRMSRMIEKESLARAREPGLNPENIPAQGHVDIVLDRKSLFLEYLSSGEERPSFLARKRLDVHGSE